jgi:hypothetical protein
MSLSPRQIVEALMRGISDGKWNELHWWFSDNAVVEYPLHCPCPPGWKGNMPSRNTLPRSGPIH